MMKVILLLACTVLTQFSAAIAADQWFDVQTPVRSPLRDVVMNTMRHGVSVGSAGALLETHDGGVSWSSASVSGAHLLSDVELRAVTSVADGGIVAVGERGRIVRSADDGYVASVIDTSYSLDDVASADGTVVVCTGRDAQGSTLIIRSTDAGATFTRIVVPESLAVLRCVRFVSSSLGFAVGSRPKEGVFAEAVILRTTDAGITWSTVYTVDDMHLTSVALSHGDLVACGITGFGRGGVFRSTSAGETWTKEARTDMDFITDMVGSPNDELMAVGYERVPIEGDLASSLCIYRSTDAGENWAHIIVDGQHHGTPALSVTADRAVIVADSGRAWISAHSPMRAQRQIETRLRHIEFGSVAPATFRDSVVASLFTNTSVHSVRIVQAVIADAEGSFSLREPLVGTEIPVGGTLNAHLRFTPQEAGERWGLLTVVFNNGQESVIHLSGVQGGMDQAGPLADVASLIDLGVVNDLRGAEFEVTNVFRNVGDSSLAITRIAIDGGDASAFALVNIVVPIEVTPGTQASLQVMMQPHTAGIYRTTLLIDVNDTTLRIPLVATSRMEDYDEIVDLGTVRVGSTVSASVAFTSSTWQSWFNGLVLQPLQEPFAFVDFDQRTEDSVHVELTATPLATGLYVAPLFGEWSFGDSRVGYTERKVVRMNVIEGTTSVHGGDASPSVRIDPQPVGNALRITAEQITDDATATIIDLHGRTHMSVAIAGSNAGVHTTVDTSMLPTGAYCVVIRSGARVSVQSFIKAVM